jgi:hypothetical protein
MTGILNFFVEMYLKFMYTGRIKTFIVFLTNDSFKITAMMIIIIINFDYNKTGTSAHLN